MLNREHNKTPMPGCQSIKAKSGERFPAPPIDPIMTAFLSERTYPGSAGELSNRIEEIERNRELDPDCFLMRRSYSHSGIGGGHE
jgi:hypothetical protein